MNWISAASGLLRVLLLTPFLFALSAQAQDAKPFSNEQLDQLTAQIALYPDSLLAQLLMATTYPEDFAAAAAWSKAHPDAKGDDAVKMVENEPWDPSVASLVAFPEVLITFGGQPDWVRNIGDAFLAQPDDVMNSVQRLRQKAQAAGNLKSNEQVTVSMQAPEVGPDAAPQTVVVQQAAPPPQVIVIQPAQPSVVFVPSFNPTVVYGPWPWVAYPPFFFPPPPGFWWSRPIATGIAWGVGIGVSNALWGGVRWGGGWGHNSVNINVNRYNNINVNRRLDVNNRTRELEPQSGSARQHAVPWWRCDAQEPREPARCRQPRAVSRQGRGEPRRQSGTSQPGDAEPRRGRGQRVGARTRAKRGPQRHAEPGAKRRSQRCAGPGAERGPQRGAEPGADVDRSAVQDRAQNVRTAVPRRTGRRTRTAMRRASVPSPPAATTRCGVPTARRQVRRSTAAEQARRPRSVPAAVLPRSAPAAAAVAEPVRPPVAVARGHRQAAAVVARRAAAVADVVVETEPMNMKNIKHTLQIAALAGALAMAPLTFAQTAYPTPKRPPTRWSTASRGTTTTPSGR